MKMKVQLIIEDKSGSEHRRLPSRITSRQGLPVARQPASRTAYIRRVDLGYRNGIAMRVGVAGKTRGIHELHNEQRDVDTELL